VDETSLVPTSHRREEGTEQPRLQERLGRGQAWDTWTALAAGDRPVAVKRIRCEDMETRRRLLDVAARLCALDHALVPVQGASVVGEEVWVVADLDGGMCLRRLLGVARLSPAQSGAIVQAVLGALSSLHAAGLCHGAVHAGNVHVGRDGRVRLGDGGLRPALGGSMDAAEGRTVDLRDCAALLGQLLASTPPSSAATALDAAAQQDLVRRIATADSASSARAALVEMPAVGGPDALEAAVRELGALASRLPPRSSPAADQVGSARPVKPGAAPLQPDHAVPLPVPLRLVILACGGVVAAAVVVATIVLVTRHHASQQVAMPTPIPRATASAPPTPPGNPRRAVPSLPVLAPASAGDIAGAGVTPRPGTCSGAPGTPCVVIVRVYLHPHSQEAVSWTVDVIDRCTGAVKPEASSTIVAIRAYAYVFDTFPIAVPSGSAVAIVAVTTAPARAASPPLLVGPAPVNC